mgnify:CR=1 FL=1
MFLFARKFQFCAMLVLSPEDKVIGAKYDAEKSFSSYGDDLLGYLIAGRVNANGFDSFNFVCNLASFSKPSFLLILLG